MANSEKTKDELLQELSNLKEQLANTDEHGGICPIDGLNAEECIDFFKSMVAAITEPILILNSDLKCVFVLCELTDPEFAHLLESLPKLFRLSVSCH